MRLTKNQTFAISLVIFGTVILIIGVFSPNKVAGVVGALFTGVGLIMSIVQSRSPNMYINGNPAAPPFISPSPVYSAYNRSKEPTAEDIIVGIFVGIGMIFLWIVVLGGFLVIMTAIDTIPLSVMVPFFFSIVLMGIAAAIYEGKKAIKKRVEKRLHP